MAVITASLIAVGAAVASAGAVAAGVATVATIGTIAAVVGGVGLALGVAGMVTGNKTLTKIGTYLGAAAAGGGLGALAAQGMGLGAAAASGSSAATSGTGAAASSASSSVPETLANPELGASIAGSIQQAGQTGAGTVLAPAVAQTATGAGTVLAPTATSGISQGTQAAMGGTALMSQSVPPPSREMPGVSYDTSAATRAPRPDPINDAYNIGVNNARSAGAIAPDNPKVSNTPAGPTRSEYTGLLGLAGMQMIGSTINGISQGQAASTQTQIQMDQNVAQNRLTQQQLDQQEKQRAWERQNTSYAPLVSFRGGLISNPGKA